MIQLAVILFMIAVMPDPFDRTAVPKPNNSCSRAFFAFSSIRFAILRGRFFFKSSICADNMETFS